MQLTLTGLQIANGNKPAATVEFRAGLNVITGPSDTGKTFICDSIDFLLGASTPPREIPERYGYNHAVLTFETPEKRITISRAFGDDNLRLSERSVSDSAQSDTRLMRAVHRTGDEQTLSYYLLSLIGLQGRLIRRNQAGATVSLTFRHVAHLILIDETRIIGKSSPALTGQYVTSTADQSVFSFFITGTDDAQLIQLPSRQQVRATLEAEQNLLEELIQNRESSLNSLTNEPDISSRMFRLRAAITRETERVSATQEEIETLEADREEKWEDLQRVKSRQLFLEEQLKRLRLLRQFYNADKERLYAVLEAGEAFEQLPGGICAACGSTAEFRDAEALANTLVKFREASASEMTKIDALAQDLEITMGDMTSEHQMLTEEIQVLNRDLRSLDASLKEKLQPEYVRASEGLGQLYEQRTLLERATDIQEEIDEFKQRLETIRTARSTPEPRKRRRTRVSTGSATEFCSVIEELLVAWQFPLQGGVAFDPQRFDIVLGSRDRGGLGKGYRALTHAAFTIGLMRYCRRKGIPHPGFVILDTPLNPLRGPDEGSEGHVSDEIKNAFYRDLASNTDGEQVIILENTEPPADTLPLITYTHFTKNSSFGRYGFFPG